MPSNPPKTPSSGSISIKDIYDVFGTGNEDTRPKEELDNYYNVRYFDPSYPYNPGRFPANSSVSTIGLQDFYNKCFLDPALPYETYFNNVPGTYTYTIPVYRDDIFIDIWGGGGGGGSIATGANGANGTATTASVAGLFLLTANGGIGGGTAPGNARDGIGGAGGAANVTIYNTPRHKAKYNLAGKAGANSLSRSQPSAGGDGGDCRYHYPISTIVRDYSFPYYGYESIVIPTGVTSVKITASGAGGGSGGDDSAGWAAGYSGHAFTGSIPVKGGDILKFFVGGAGGGGASGGGAAGGVYGKSPYATATGTKQGTGTLVSKSISLNRDAILPWGGRANEAPSYTQLRSRANDGYYIVTDNPVTTSNQDQWGNIANERRDGISITFKRYVVILNGTIVWSSREFPPTNVGIVGKYVGTYKETVTGGNERRDPVYEYWNGFDYTYTEYPNLNAQQKYEGGNGGSAGSVPYSGAGGGGGAATVVSLNDNIILVAGGGAGQGGAGQHSRPQGRATTPQYTGYTYGGYGQNKGGGDGAGGGAGGGGVQGGSGGNVRGGDDGAFAGWDGSDLVPSGFSSIPGVSGGTSGPGVAGTDGYVNVTLIGTAIAGLEQTFYIGQYGIGGGRGTTALADMATKSITTYPASYASWSPVVNFDIGQVGGFNGTARSNKDQWGYAGYLNGKVSFNKASGVTVTVDKWSADSRESGGGTYTIARPSELFNADGSMRTGRISGSNARYSAGRDTSALDAEVYYAAPYYYIKIMWGKKGSGWDGTGGSVGEIRTLPTIVPEYTVTTGSDKTYTNVVVTKEPYNTKTAFSGFFTRTTVAETNPYLNVKEFWVVIDGMIIYNGTTAPPTTQFTNGAYIGSDGPDPVNGNVINAFNLVVVAQQITPTALGAAAYGSKGLDGSAGGGGGGGGGSYNQQASTTATTYSGGGGGGAGGFTRIVYSRSSGALPPGSVITFTVGSGGLPATYTNAGRGGPGAVIVRYGLPGAVDDLA